MVVSVVSEGIQSFKNEPAKVFKVKASNVFDEVEDLLVGWDSPITESCTGGLLIYTNYSEYIRTIRSRDVAC